MAEINGTWEPGWEPVRDRFALNFDKGREVGASVCVILDGRPVVDLWAGSASADGSVPWERDTIVNVYSTTKTMSFLVTLMLADRGLLELDAPVGRYWPEFAANGKERVEVRHLLTHSAGVAGWDVPLRPEELYDWDLVVARLAAQAPWWEPGTAAGYHALTQGYLLGELVRRTDGRTMGTFFRQEVAEPLGADFHIGLDAAHDPRVAELVPPEGRGLASGSDRSSLVYRVHANPGLTGREPTTEGWRRAEIPAGGGIGNARSVARVHAAMACGGEVDGVRLLSPEMVDRALTEQLYVRDQVLGMKVRYGMGFALPSKEAPISPNQRVGYWGGWGGSLAVVDVDARMSFGYVMNRMEAGLTGDPRGGSLILATYSTLAALR